MSEIRDVIEKFSFDQRPREATGETAGFLSVEDIPQHLRREFAAALAALSGQGNYRQSPKTAPTLSVTDIWG